MAIQTINIGGYANDGTGDDLRTAFEKVNANFTALSTDAAVNGAENVGTGAGVYKGKNVATLQFKTLTSTDNSVQFGVNENTIDVTSFASIVEDTTPQLGGNLDLNDHSIVGIGNIGDSNNNITINGVKMLDVVNILELLMFSNMFSLDFGTILLPTGGTGPYDGFDLGSGTILNPSLIKLNFGSIA